MLIYSTPGTGKTTLCRQHGFTDGDDLLYAILKSHFRDIDFTYFSRGILCCFDEDFLKAEMAYEEYKQQLFNLRKADRITLFGSRRFIWLAEKVYRETDEQLLISRSKDCVGDIVQKEQELCVKHRIQYTLLNGKFLNVTLLKQSHGPHHSTTTDHQQDVSAGTAADARQIRHPL